MWAVEGRAGIIGVFFGKRNLQCDDEPKLIKPLKIGLEVLRSRVNPC